MKKRIEDDKHREQPMFPRLHINDTEKGGPRAPPRNKMALYEQLTIPSQSCNSGGAVPPTLNPNNKETNCERRRHLPEPPLPTSYSNHELQRMEVVNLSNQPSQTKQTMSPVAQCSDATQNSGYEEGILSNGGKKANHDSGDLISRKGINQERRNMRVSNAPKRYSDIAYQKKREKDGVQQGQQDKCILNSPEENEVCGRQDLGIDLRAVGTRFGEDDLDMPMASTQKDISLQRKHNPCIGYGCGNANGIGSGMQRINDTSLARENVDRGDDMSETSVLDSASALDISIEDVGMLGIENYCRARTAIANQQRMLAAQVFELHRLMKVQGLIAESPHLLLKDSAFMDEALKDSNVRNYSSEFAVEAPARAIKKKDDSKEPNDEVECTADNALTKTPPVLAPKSSPPVNTDPEMSSWSFHQPASHQWLLPVMCPSQGLVYKPCSAPGFMGPIYGGYGPPGSIPVVGNIMHPAYGMGQGFHYGRHGYFQPYGMPIMSPSVPGPVVDKMNKFSHADGPQGQLGQPGGVSTKSSSNGPTQKNGSTMRGAKDGESQRSAFISPSQEAKGPGTACLTKGEDALPRFPMPTVTEKSSGVIRVVPRDRRSTRESAARIFRSIQDERQQQGSN